MRVLLCLLLITGVSFNSKTQPHNSFKVQMFEVPDIEGSWKSVGPENYHNGTFGSRVYSFENNSWSETIIIYEDAEFKYPLFRLRNEGYFDITTTHPEMYRTYFVNFHYSRKTLTVLTNDKEKVKLLGFRNCFRGKDEEIDLTQSECGFVKSAKEIPVRYDIVKKDLDLLFLGIQEVERITNTVEKRPTFFHYPLRKFDPRKESEWVKNRKYVYTLMQFEVRNEVNFGKFMEGYVESMHKFGGRRIVHSNNLESYEGTISDPQLMILIWPDKEQFDRWWNSRDFNPWKKLLFQSTKITVSLSTDKPVEENAQNEDN